MPSWRKDIRCKISITTIIVIGKRIVKVKTGTHIEKGCHHSSGGTVSEDRFSPSTVASILNTAALSREATMRDEYRKEDSLSRMLLSFARPVPSRMFRR